MTQSSSVLKKPSIEAAVGVLAGIDIGMHAAKLVVAHRHNHGLNVTRASCLPISPEIQGDGRMLARLLCDWLRENSEPGCRDFAATLPSSMVDYEAIQIPSPALMDIDEFAHQAINDLLGNESSLATYDYWSSAENHGSDSNTLHVAWASKEFASQLSTGLARDGWRCIALEIPAQTLARIQSFGERRASHSIMVDIGAGEATLAFVKNCNCEYFRSRIRFASDSASGLLAHAFGMGKHAAEHLLAYWGLGDDNLNPSNPLETLILQNLTEWLQELVYEIRRTLNFLKHRHDAESDCQLLLCGGGANIRGLPEWLSNELQTHVRFATPAADWSWSSAERYSPAYAQALSLATYGVHR